MSKIGKLPIKLPPQVTVQIDGSKVVVTGSGGTLERHLPAEIARKLRTVGSLSQLRKLRL